MANYRPRHAAFLTVPNLGTPADRIAQQNTDDTTRLPVRVKSASLVVNDYNHADTLEIDGEWQDVGFDPRFLPQAVCEYYAGDANDRGDWVPTQSNLVFAGIMQRPRRSGGEEEGMNVKLQFYDYTTLFLETKNYPPSGLPFLDEDLLGAWQRVCDHTGIPQSDGTIASTVIALRDRLVFGESVEDIGSLIIGSACLPRFRKLARLTVKPNADSWAVWQQCCAMLGLISYIYLDQCFVVSALDYYTEKDPPRLSWGTNVLHIDEERATKFSQKGVGVSSFDPLSYTTLEAVYPPVGDKRIATKKPAVAQKRTKKNTPPKITNDRDWFEYPAITDPDRLMQIAQRIYEERSRQELDGNVQTAEIVVKTVGGSDFNLLRLKAGDTLRVEFDQNVRDCLTGYGSPQAQLTALLATGISPDVAKFLVKNFQGFVNLSSNFFVKSVTVRIDSDNEDFDISVGYCNRIQIDGSTTSQ